MMLLLLLNSSLHRLLPEPILKASLATINKTITNFAVNSFQSGSKKQFKEFMMKEKI